MLFAASGLLYIAVIFSVADWYAVVQNVTWLRYSAKPFVIITLASWLLFQPIPFSRLLWFFLALVFSLGGDIWLLAPPRFFMAGLVTFLMAHISYVIGLNPEPLPANWQVFILGSVFILLGVFIYPIIYNGVKKQPGARKLQGATLIYFMILSLMVFSANATLFRPDWQRLPAMCVAIGGVFFYSSDFLLAYDRFIHPLQLGRLAVHVTYHLGQFGLITGIIWQLLLRRVV